MLGYGLGLRSAHYEHVLGTRPAIDWFELISENFLAPGGRPRSILRRIRADYPVVLHGLSFNIGTDEPVDLDYVRQLKALIQDIEPEWVSDHICWTGLHGRTSHDLLPIAYNRDTLGHCITKVNQIQDLLQQPIVLENPSSYVQFRTATMPEHEFINALTRATGCGLLLDVNNVYVSSFNLGFSAEDYLHQLDTNIVRQFHLAGHSNNQTHIIDTHDQPVCDAVWALYELACQRFGPVATLLERDDNFPEFSALEQELTLARQVQERALQVSLS